MANSTNPGRKARRKPDYLPPDVAAMWDGFPADIKEYWLTHGRAIHEKEDAARKAAYTDRGHKPPIAEAEMDATIDRVAKELFSRKPTWFGVVQAAIWIATGRLELVEMTGANESSTRQFNH